MIRLLKLVMGFCLLFAGAMAGFRLLGLHLPAPHSIIMLHLIDCTPPCWLGIQPGTTSVKEAKARLVAAYREQSDLKIEDAGFADGPISLNAVENTIEGADFYLNVRLDTGQVIDGESETVQSISLSQSRADGRRFAPTAADILGTYGPPLGVVVDEVLTNRYLITLEYQSLAVVFHSNSDHLDLNDTPQIYLSDHITHPRSANYRSWKGFSLIAPGG